MLEPLLGSTTRERVLVFLLGRDSGYASEISRFYAVDLTPVQKQLEKLEAGGVLVSQPVGRTRVYSLNPRYAFRAELRALLTKVLSFYPDDLRAGLLLNRRRPRRAGKPIQTVRG
jgi:predicted transcriptional regulator